MPCAAFNEKHSTASNALRGSSDRLAATVDDFKFEIPITIASEAGALSYVRAILEKSLADAEQEYAFRLVYAEVWVWV